MPLHDAVVLLTSTEPDKNNSFGSAFIIARDNNYSYLLTCAHVVKQINGKEPCINKLKVFGLEQPVEIVPNGSNAHIDMALLKVSGLFDKPLFDKFIIGQEQTDIHIAGYSLFDPKTGDRIERPLNGKLGQRNKLAANDCEYPFWDVSIQGGSFSKLEDGYSGSPLYNQTGQVIGVISHRRTGEYGYAFCISNLKTLYPEITRLIPSLGQLEKNPVKPNVSRHYTPDPSFLPYLLDREEQEEDLIDAIKAHGDYKHPLLCVIHGTADDCCSDSFINRVEKCVLPQIPATQKQLKDISAHQFLIEAGAFKNAEQLHRNMQRSLGSEFVKDKTADPTQISQAFYRAQRPILLYFTISTKDCLRCDGTKTVQHFLRFWQDWQAHHQQNYLILVFLYFYYEPQQKNLVTRLLRKKDFNLQIEENLNTLDFAEFGLHGKVLRKLPLIEETHIREWAHSKHIHNFYKRSIYEDVRLDIEKIYQQHKTGALTLGHIVRELQPLLKQLAPQVKP